jgi:riboflavin kinase / FMN adenylyltransferase
MMRIVRQSDFTEACVATVGFFDGVHLGHRYLISELLKIAQKKKLPAVIFTFAVHPRKVLHSEYQPQLLTTLSEKLKLLETSGIDACVVLDFTPEMSLLSAYDFLKKILKDKNSVQTLLVGHDHRFGHNRTDGFEQYKQYGDEFGLEVVQAKKYITSTHLHISSSDIRNALLKGDITTANDILTYRYSFVGKVVKGFEVGRKIGFPTANLEPIDSEKLIPAVGVYAVEVIRDNTSLRGMMNIGFRPTLENGNQLSIEVHIFGFNENIYHELIEIRFLKKIRDERKFASIDELIEQLKMDRLSAFE